VVEPVKRHAIIAKVQGKPKGSCFAVVANDSGMITNGHEVEPLSAPEGLKLLQQRVGALDTPLVHSDSHQHA
jgi:hypothetical protein